MRALTIPRGQLATRALWAATALWAWQLLEAYCKKRKMLAGGRTAAVYGGTGFAAVQFYNLVVEKAAGVIQAGQDAGAAGLDAVNKAWKRLGNMLRQTPILGPLLEPLIQAGDSLMGGLRSAMLGIPGKVIVIIIGGYVILRIVAR